MCVSLNVSLSYVCRSKGEREKGREGEGEGERETERERGQSTKEHTTIKCIHHTTNFFAHLIYAGNCARSTADRRREIAPPFKSVAEEDVERVGFQPQIWVGALHLSFTLCGT